MDGCVLCDVAAAADLFTRRTVWQDDLWRLSLIEEGSPVPGFGHLEPIRHIPYITDLDGEEAATLGAVLALVTTALKQVTQAELVYVYVFGERTPHLHFNLAPHNPGDALVGGPGLLRDDATVVASEVLKATNRQVQTLLATAT